MTSFDYDVLIIGSGFGGSVAALRAAASVDGRPRTDTLRATRCIGARTESGRSFIATATPSVSMGSTRKELLRPVGSASVGARLAGVAASSLRGDGKETP